MEPGFEQAAVARASAPATVTAAVLRMDRAVIVPTPLLKINCYCEQLAIKQQVKGFGRRGVLTRRPRLRYAGGGSSIRAAIAS
ncbi:hypothetical protein GCM10010299_14570 [Streptomyces tanashiensis]|nr:hypothetical protein GCM10010299_14570 [Streptomyces tanashiensis]